MNRSTSSEWIFLFMIALPILYLLGQGVFGYSFEFDLLFVFLATWVSGPLLLVYGFLARRLTQNKLLATLSLAAGTLWVGFEILLVIKVIR